MPKIGVCPFVVRCQTAVVVGLLSLVCAATSARAQLTTAEEKGFPPNSVFSGGDVDTVNLQNGNLHISIPIASSAQRGGTIFKWAFVYDTQAWIKQWHSFCTPPTTCNPSGQYLPAVNTNVVSGWRLTSPLNWGAGYTNNSGPINCINSNQTYQAYTNWIIGDPEGTQHPLPLRKESASCLGQTLAGPALDGSGLYYDSQAQIIYTKDGYQYTSSAGPVFAGQDRNGNTATTTSDTLERNLVTTYNGTTSAGLPYTTYTINNSAGKPLVFRVDYQNVAVTSDICAATNGAYPCTDISQTQILPSMLTLPTGKTYVFKYTSNTPGDLYEMDLPTGAVITYQYQDFYQTKFVTQPGLHSPQPNYVGSRAVKSRTVAVDGQTYLWTYTPSVTTDTVTDPLLNVQVHTFSTVNASGPSGLVASSNLFEMGVVYKDSKGNTLRTVSNKYAADYDPVDQTAVNERITQTTTTLDNGQASQKQTDFNDTFSYPCVNEGGACTGTATRLNPTEIREYDYGTSGVGPLIRRTDYAYQHTNNQSYINLNIVDKPTTIKVYDGSGALAAQTVNEYDKYSHTGQQMQSSGAVQHNPNYGTGFTTRGNLTAVSRWNNQSGSYLTTTNQYDDAGNLLSTIDPDGNQTSYSYSDSWAGAACVPSGASAAYRTKITNAKGQFSTTTYYACTGTIGTTTDPNLKQTIYAYDSFDRPSRITFPDKGFKNYCYSDDINGACYKSTLLFMGETDAINSSGNLDTTTLYDGLGRVAQTQINSDPYGTISTLTEYDGDGRVLKVSNPHRSGDTIYWTTQLYDGIGRSAGVLNQDGSSTSISYTGNIATSTDEALNKRKSETDALGRLTYVWEDPSGLNFETDYQYDVLGNLRNVTQHGSSSDTARTRGFTFDSLSRLISTVNPETGTTGYSYDGDGNVKTKTDARSVMTTYTYDALNRLVSKSYSDGTTPSSCYQYDTPVSSVTDSNPVGELTLEWTQAGSCPSPSSPQSAVPASAFTSSVLANHDALGRIQNEQQYTPASLASGTYYAPAYTYDLAGNIVTSTSGAGPTLTNYIDRAGRIGCVTSSWAPNSSPGSSPWPLFTAQTGQISSCPVSLSSVPVPYTPFGGLQNAAYGYNGMIVNRTFDSRMRPTSETDKGGAPSSPTNASTTITITGSEQVH